MTNLMPRVSIGVELAAGGRLTITPGRKGFEMLHPFRVLGFWVDMMLVNPRVEPGAIMFDPFGVKEPQRGST